MYNLKNFKAITKPVIKDACLLTYFPKSSARKAAYFSYSATTGNKLLSFKSGERFQVFLSDKVVALVANKNGRLIFSPTQHKACGAFSNAALQDLVNNLFNGQAFHVEGVVDEKQNAVFFDLNNAVLD